MAQQGAVVPAWPFRIFPEVRAEMTTPDACLWCGRTFARRRGGSPQRFCSPGHRVEFHTAARVWTERALVAGSMTIADLRNGVVAPCTLPTGANSPVPLQGQAGAAVMAKTLGDMLDDILKLSQDQLNALPKCIWKLMVYANELSSTEAS
jgi:hypothetical protein